MTLMPEKKLTLPALLLAGGIALGLSICGFSLYKGIYFFKMSDRVITVKGLVEEIVKSDFANFTVDVVVAGNDLQTAYAEVSKYQSQVKDFFLKSGFDEKEVANPAPSVTDNHARTWGSDMPLHRYVVTAAVTLATEKVDACENLRHNLGKLIEIGVPITGTHTDYQYKKFADIRPVMLQKATQNARQVAAQFASDAGTNIGAIRRAHQGSFSIVSPDALPDDRAGEASSSLMKKVRVVSTIEFFLD